VSDIENQIKYLNDTIYESNRSKEFYENRVIQLEKELEKLQLEKESKNKIWKPSEGKWFVNYDGMVTSETELLCFESDKATDFGCRRDSELQTVFASRNMRMFNRISCYMKDIKPIVSFNANDVSITFSDWDGTLVHALEKDITEGRFDING
jgi:hypothetical protein